MTKQRAFVTGGTGFLGINLIAQLIEAGWEVYALHRPSSNLKYLQSFPVHLLAGSLADAEGLKQVIPEEVEAVFHVAGNTNLWKKGNAQQYQDNVIGTGNMVAAALAKKAGKFIHTSSISAFGLHSKIIDENTPSNAENCGVNYHRTKYLAELEVEKGIEQGLEAVILNPCHIMGAYDQSSWAQLIKLTAQEALPGIPPGEGMYGYAQDIAAAHIAAVSKGKTGERYLLGGEKANFLKVINLVEDYLGKTRSTKSTAAAALKLMVYWGKVQSLWKREEPKITPEKYLLLTEYSICNDQKAQKVLGYQHSPLEVMVEAACNWLKAEKII